MADDVNKNTKLFRRALKRAKVFAIQHLTRKIRLLTKKRGTEQQVEKNLRKAERFQEELECIKDLDINIVLQRIQNKTDTSDISTTKDDFKDIQERALARLISSKPIQNRLKELNDKKDNVSQPKTVEILSNVKLRATNSGKENLKKIRNENPNTISLKQSVVSSDTTEKCSISSENSDEDIVMERTATSCFVKSMNSIAKDDNLKKRLKNGKKYKKVPKKSTNRSGQRTRQKLWKERYGNQAKHVKSETNIRKTGKPERLKQDKSGLKRKDKSEESVRHPSWEASKRRKLQHNISQTQFQGTKITFEDSD